jgi:hypothetical protein
MYLSKCEKERESATVMRVGKFIGNIPYFFKFSGISNEIYIKKDVK